MKILNHPTVLLLSSLAMLSLSVMADDKKPASNQRTDADNTANNERDKSGGTKTPLDQSNRPEDIKITQDIRKAVMADDGLSMTAKNVKIITTADGKVTLRGPVNNEEEKTKIDALAKKVAGSMPVVNQLEVKAAKN
ncbi:MAG: osmY [Prosthecobacter sp.]|nr:osmY [Prosthecobacter sp.]